MPARCHCPIRFDAPALGIARAPLGYAAAYELRPEVEVDLGDVIEKLEQAAMLALEHVTGTAKDRLEVALGMRDRGQRQDHFCPLLHDPDASDPDLEALADAIPNDDAQRAEWIAVGLAFFAASDGSAAGLNAWERWSRKSSKGHGGTAARWESFATSPPDRTGVGALVQRAKRAVPGFRLPSWGPEKQADSATAAAPGAPRLDITHDGLALDMGRKWADARHVALWGHWLFWAGSCWERDERLLHLTRTRDYLRQKGDELVRWAKAKNDEKLVETCEAIAKQLRSAQMVANVVGLARSNPAQVATVDQWDADPFELGAPKPARTPP